MDQEKANFSIICFHYTITQRMADHHSYVLSSAIVRPGLKSLTNFDLFTEYMSEIIRREPPQASAYLWTNLWTGAAKDKAA